MPRLQVVLLLFAIVPASLVIAQPSAPVAAAGNNWARVQVLPAGTTVSVKGRDRHLVCKLVSVDGDGLRCSDHAKALDFQRAEIRSVKMPRRGRSALIGLGFGAGTGAVVGFAVGTKSGGYLGANFLRGAVTAVFGVVGGVIGAPVGYATDFTRSTVYTAP